MSCLKKFLSPGTTALIAVMFVAVPIFGQDVHDAGTYDGDASTAARANDQHIDEIRSLIAGILDVTVEPQSLFDVPLADENAVRIESVRLRALLSTVEISKRAALVRTVRKSPVSTASTGTSVQAEIDTLDPAEWAVRVELDRARLDFYLLSSQRREELLRDHAARVQASRPPETDEHRRMREAEEERQRALTAAQNARSEAERLVREEEARLIGLEGSVTAVRAQFRTQHDELAAAQDMVLGWQRRVREAKAAGAPESDLVYDALRRTLFVSRNELSAALDSLGSTQSAVPALGPDPLSDVPTDISTEDARHRRLSVNRQIELAQSEEHALRDFRASILQDRINSFNRERLGLIPYLSPSKQASITGFTTAGLDQARAEARHLHLVVRYHHYVATAWLQSLRHRQDFGVANLWRVIAGSIPWLLTILAFVWWRRRSPMLIALAEARFTEIDQSERRATPSRSLRIVRLLSAIRPQLEWLLFFSTALWLLPVSARGLLEVELLTVVVGWTLGGALIVNVINSVAAARDPLGHQLAKDVATLRLQSLRLVGRVVVAFALLLLLTARLVGEGTVYRWALSTCWLAAIPVFLVLVRRWRETIFSRLEKVRRKSPLQVWVLANRGGWKSFLAAMVGGVHLFTNRLLKVGRNWLSGFMIARRAHAYLFKRTLDRLANENRTSEYHPLKSEILAFLGPDNPSNAWIECPADEYLAFLNDQVTERHGGVVAIVGGRGMGKSSLLRQLGARAHDALQIACDADTSALTISTAIGQRAQEREASPDSLVVPSLVLLDDVQALVKPRIGGLKTFDEILQFARIHSSSSLWIMAIDRVAWPFLQRARDARPLFDKVIALRPWTDEQIGTLLSNRSTAHNISPIFDDLLEDLPLTADEIDRQEATVAKRAGYFRMIWDYARGNPGVALQVWRKSLVEDNAGTVRVRPLQAPNAAELDGLSDQVFFILRAVLQMGPTTPDEVAQSTSLSESHVRSILQYGQAHGYLIEDNGKVLVSWLWLRSVVLILERRHLLVNA